MARGKTTPDAKKEQIRAILMTSPDASSRDIAKIVKLPDSTVRTLIPELMTADEFDQYRHAKKTEFITAAWDTVKKIHLKINEKLENMDVEQLAKVNIRDLAVALGTIYDKQALASGEPTIISERQEPTPEIVKDMAAKMEKMKQLIKRPS